MSHARRELLRVIDANVNRALEGLRVCEEIARFDLEQPRLFRRLRALRHDVALTVRRLPLASAELIRSRESHRDIGRRAPASPLRCRDQLVIINFQRAKESLRTLEECARVVAPRLIGMFQRLRFRTYDVERDTVLWLATVRHP